MSVEKMTGYRFPFSQPSVFDEEQVSAIQLAARTAKKVDECVDEVNTIPEKIQTKFAQYMDDGTIANLIADNILAEMTGDIDDLEAGQAELAADVAYLQPIADKYRVVHPKFNMFGGQLARLKYALSNPLEQFTGIVFVGDSITWGKTVPNNGALVNQNYDLADDRDDFASKSFVNEFKRYIGQKYFAGEPVLSNWQYSNDGQAIATYTKELVFLPYGDDFTLTKVTGTGLETYVLTEPDAKCGVILKLTDSSTGIDDTNYHSLKFKFTGTTFDLYFWCVDESATFYKVYVDGVLQGTYSTHAGIDGFIDNKHGNKRTHTFDFVRDKEIEIRTFKNGEADTRALRIEGIGIQKTVEITNHGIYGLSAYQAKTNTLNGGAYGNSVYGKHGTVFFMLGTNDRIIRYGVAQGEQGFRTNLDECVNLILPYCKDIVFMCPPPAVNNDPTVYSMDTADIRNAIIRYARDKYYDVINHYDLFQNAEPSAYLTDGIHPNEFGHGAIKDNIIAALEMSDAKPYWRTWVPKWTGLTIGGAEVTARYMEIAPKVVLCEVSVKFAGDTVWTGSPSFDVPFVAKQEHRVPYYMNDNGTTFYEASAIVQTNGTVNMRGVHAVSGSYITCWTIPTATIPFTWATNDKFQISFVTEIR